MRIVNHSPAAAAPAVETAAVSLRALKSADLPAVARVHAAAFPESALTKLGIECVRRYYDWQLNGPHDVLALGAFRGEQLAGFCFGGLFRGATSGFLKRNRLYLSWRVVTHPWLAANPMFRDRLVVGTRVLKRMALRNGKHSDPAKTERAPALRSFGILSIAVDPKHQGFGLGKVLMNKSEAEARVQGFNAMDLTVHTDNEQAIAFYEGLEWRKIQQNGVWQGLMRKSLPKVSV
jgi:ribosomal protein S18 acetylase RimI-like enzyme